MIKIDATIEELIEALSPVSSYTGAISSAHKICDFCANGYQEGKYSHKANCLAGKRETLISKTTTV